MEILLYRFQLIRFKPIGREFVAEPIPPEDFSRQIDAPAKSIIEPQQKHSKNKPQTHTLQSIDTLQPQNKGFGVMPRCVDEEFDRSLHYIKARYYKALTTSLEIGGAIYSPIDAPLQLTEQLRVNSCLDRDSPTVSTVNNSNVARLSRIL